MWGLKPTAPETSERAAHQVWKQGRMDWSLLTHGTWAASLDHPRRLGFVIPTPHSAIAQVSAPHEDLQILCISFTGRIWLCVLHQVLFQRKSEACHLENHFVAVALQGALEE